MVGESESDEKGKERRMEEGEKASRTQHAMEHFSCERERKVKESSTGKMVWQLRRKRERQKGEKRERQKGERE